jgi:hypothetical protein
MWLGTTTITASQGPAFDHTDGTYVYDPSCLIYPSADPKTFVPLSPYYKKDETHVYEDGDTTGNNPDPPTLIVGADPATFTLIADPSGITGYSSEYTKDKDKVFVYGEFAIPGANPATFAVDHPPGGTPCHPYDAHDANHLYERGALVPLSSESSSTCTTMWQ